MRSDNKQRDVLTVRQRSAHLLAVVRQLGDDPVLMVELSGGRRRLIVVEVVALVMMVGMVWEDRLRCIRGCGKIRIASTVIAAQRRLAAVRGRVGFRVGGSSL